jgi:hypothetical protein
MSLGFKNINILDCKCTLPYVCAFIYLRINTWKTGIKDQIDFTILKTNLEKHWKNVLLLVVVFVLEIRINFYFKYDLMFPKFRLFCSSLCTLQFTWLYIEIMFVDNIIIWQIWLIDIRHCITPVSVNKMKFLRGYFIKQRGSQFWRFKARTLALAQLWWVPYKGWHHNSWRVCKREKSPQTQVSMSQGPPLGHTPKSSHHVLPSSHWEPSFQHSHWGTNQVQTITNINPAFEQHLNII